LIAMIAATPLPKMAVARFLRNEVESDQPVLALSAGILRITYILLLFAVSISYIVSSTFNPFIYFRF